MLLLLLRTRRRATASRRGRASCSDSPAFGASPVDAPTGSAICMDHLVTVMAIGDE